MNTARINLTAAVFLCVASSLHGATPAQKVDEKPSARVITLERAYDIALAGDQTIRIAVIEAHKAKLLPLSALTRLGPSLSANGMLEYSHSRSSYSGASVSTNTPGGAVSSSPSFGISSSQASPQSPSAGGNSGSSNTVIRTAGLNFSETLLDFTVFPAYRLGKLQSRAAHLQHSFTVRQTLFGVAQAYYIVLKQQRVVAINKETVDLSQKQLSIAESRLNAGFAAKIDVARATASLEEARNTLISSEGQLRIFKEALRETLNLSDHDDFSITEPQEAVDEVPPFDKIWNCAQAHREDYIVASLAISQDVARRDIVRAEYAPSVVAQANATWGSYSGGAGSGSYQSDGSVSIQIPILTGGQREIDLITANQEIRESHLNYEKTSKQLEFELKSACIRIETNRSSIQALRAEVDASTKNYNVVQSAYQAGTATSLDVQSALRDLNNSRISLANLLYDQQIALRDLLRAEALFEKGRVDSARLRP